MNPFVQVVLVLAAIGLAVGIVLLVRRQRYIASLESFGWRFVNSPYSRSPMG